MKAVALVGGQGTRLRPLTFRTPKPLLPLVNRPHIEYVIEQCDRNSIANLVMSTNYLPELFRASLGDRQLGVDLEYVHEVEPLGTAGGVKNCESMIDSTFFVFNGDVLTGVDLEAMMEYHRERESQVTIYLTPVDDPRAYGVVPLDPDGRVVAFIEKPALDEAPTNMINAGVYIIEPEVLARVPTDEPYSFERDLFPSLVADGTPIFGFESDAYWLDIGTPPKYLQAHVDLLTGACPTSLRGEPTSPGVWIDGEVSIDESVLLTGPVAIGAGSQIGKGTEIIGPASIGSSSSIGEGTIVSGSVIADGVSIGESCEIRDAIIGEAAVIGDDCTIGELAVVGPGALIAAGNELQRGIRVYPDAEVGPQSIQF